MKDVLDYVFAGTCRCVFPFSVVNSGKYAVNKSFKRGQIWIYSILLLFNLSLRDSCNGDNLIIKLTLHSFETPSVPKVNNVAWATSEKEYVNVCTAYIKATEGAFVFGVQPSPARTGLWRVPAQHGYLGAGTPADVSLPVIVS